MFNFIPQPNLHRISTFLTKPLSTAIFQKSVCIVVSVYKQSVLQAKQSVLGRKQSVCNYKQIYKQLNFQHITL